MSADASVTSSLSTSPRRRYRPRALTPLVTTLTETGRQSAITSVSDEREPVQRVTPLGGRPRRSRAAPRYPASELDGLSAFSDAGGRVPLTSRHGESRRLGTVRPDSVGSRTSRWPHGEPVRPLVRVRSLYNMHDYYLNYENVYATPTGDTDLTEGVDRAVFDAASPFRAVTPHSRRRNRQRSRRPVDRTRTASLPARGTSSLSVTRRDPQATPGERDQTSSWSAIVDSSTGANHPQTHHRPPSPASPDLADRSPEREWVAARCRRNRIRLRLPNRMRR